VKPPILNFKEAPEEIKNIVNLLPSTEKEKLISWIDDLLESNYSGWEAAMGEDI